MDLYDQTCRMMCQGANCIVIAVDFSLAPEHRFPAAPEDCYAATCWVALHAKELHINPDYIGVWGESCGGNLATVVAMMARDRNYPKLCCQIIITAMLDYNFKTPSYIEKGQGEYLLSENSMRWFWNHYLSNKDDIKNPYCAPLQSNNLTNLAKALIVTVEYDPLCDEGQHYAEKLIASGIEAKHICYSGLIHDFFDLYHLSQQANTACEEIITVAKQWLNP
jgi:acetyl esterase